MNEQKMRVLAALKRYDIEVEGTQIYRVGSPDGRYVLFDDVAAIVDAVQHGQREAVNQQMLDALKAIAAAEIFDPMASAVAMQTLARGMVNGIAAEAAQPADDQENGDPAATLNRICDLLQVGKIARTPCTILTNIENTLRRSRCLSAVESEFFTLETRGDDGELNDECPLLWGAMPAEYVEQFRAALAAQQQGEPVDSADQPAPASLTKYARMILDRHAGDYYPCAHCGHPCRLKQFQCPSCLDFNPDHEDANDPDTHKTPEDRSQAAELYTAPPAPACSVPDGLIARYGYQALFNAIGEATVIQGKQPGQAIAISVLDFERALLGAAPKPEGGA